MIEIFVGGRTILVKFGRKNFTNLAEAKLWCIYTQNTEYQAVLVLNVEMKHSVLNNMQLADS